MIQCAQILAWIIQRSYYAPLSSPGVLLPAHDGRFSMDRRTFIASTGGALAAAALASCSGSTDSDPKPAELVFASDWSTATGNTQDAVRDGTKWTSADRIDFSLNPNGPVPDRVAVVPATGLGFPAGMSNVLAIKYHNATATDYCGIFKSNGWPMPTVGGVICFRLYFRMSIDGASGGRHHPVQTAPAAGPCVQTSVWRMEKGDTFAFQIGQFGSGFCNPSDAGFFSDCHSWQTTLTRNQTYRVEERWEYVAAHQWRLHVEVYDSSNTKVRSDSDFVCMEFGHAHTLADNLIIGVKDDTCFRSKLIANEGALGARGADAPAENRIFYGGFAVSLDDWCGNYVVGEGPTAGA